LSPVSVAVVDDQSLYADFLAYRLTRHGEFHVAGTAFTLADGIELVATTRPDVLLLDYQFPDGDGVDTVATFLRHSPPTKVVLTGDERANGLLLRAIRAGCAGLLDKDRSFEEILACIRQAARGELPLHSDELAILIKSLKAAIDETEHLLSPYETTIARLFSEGHGPRRVAELLSDSATNVRDHAEIIVRKLGLTARLEAAVAQAREKITPRQSSSDVETDSSN